MELLETILRREEGLKLFVYDDATGKPIMCGSTVKGNPTIGFGRSLSTHGISEDEAQQLLANDEARVRAEVTAALPWFVHLDEVRQAVLLAMAFQMGTGTSAGRGLGFLGFRHTLQAVQAADYIQAAEYMLDSPWAKQTPERAERLAELMRTGGAGVYGA